jgi:chromate transporter
MPFWHRLRAMPGAVGALRGANAAVVGVLFSAWIDPVASSAIRPAWGTGLLDVGIAAAAFAALAWLRAPAWAVVLVCGAAAWGLSQF